MSTDRGRFLRLDGLRGVAVLLVMAQHFIPLENGHTGGVAAYMVRIAAASGWVGVDLFFVLSGFLITGILIDARGSGRVLGSFYARRALRILPTFAATMFALNLVVYLLRNWDIAAFHLLETRQVWHWTFLTNVIIARDGTWDYFPLTAHLWSLAVEEQFYLVWPAVILTLPPKWTVRFTVAVVGAALLYRLVLIQSEGSALAALVLTGAKADELALGGVLALAVRNERAHKRLGDIVKRVGGQTVSLSLFLMVAIVVTMAVTTDRKSIRLGYSVGQSLIALAAAATVAAMLMPSRADVVGRLMQQPWIRRVGTYSYTLYLVHYPISALIYRSTLPQRLHTALHSTLLADLLLATSMGGLSYVLAAASYRWIERPALSLRSRFPYGSPPAHEAISIAAD